MMCSALAGHYTRPTISRKGWCNSTAIRGLKPDLGVAAQLPHLNSVGSFVLEEKAPIESSSVRNHTTLYFVNGCIVAFRCWAVGGWHCTFTMACDTSNGWEGRSC
jgi:hypothetical protein